MFECITAIDKRRPRLAHAPQWRARAAQWRAIGLLLLLVSLECLPVLWPQPTFAQAAGINTPASGAAVSGDVVISGTAVINSFQRYELYYKFEPSGDDAYIYFDGGTSPVTNGQLGVWRTTNFAAGAYSIRLRVVKADGNYDEFFAKSLQLGASSGDLTPTVTPTTTPGGEPTPTAIPTATYTPAPQPTPAVGSVTQPLFQDGGATPTPLTVATIALDPNANTGSVFSTDSLSATNGISGAVFADTDQPVTSVEGSSFTRELGEAVALDRLRSYFFTGMRFSATLAIGIIALLAGKRIFDWVWTQYR